MRLVVTEEQRELRDALRRFFADRSPAAEVRRLMGTAEGYDPKVWAQMAEQLGLQGLAIAEEHGGAGFGVRELAVVFEEMGRAVVCAPFLATITAAAALEAGDGGHDLLPGIADGSVIATLAVAEDGGSWDPGDVETTFEDGKLWGRRASSWTATSLILCWWRPGAMAAWGFMPSRMWPPFPGGSAHARPDEEAGAGRDGRRPGARGRRAGRAAAGARRGGRRAGGRGARRGPEGARHDRRVREGAAAVRAPDRVLPGDQAPVRRHVRARGVGAVGGAERGGRRRRGPRGAAAAAALAKAYCSDAYFHTAGEAIQLHGGIGFTWEHDAHLYFKRAQGSRQLFGAPDRHRERLAALAGITGAAAAP